MLTYLGIIHIDQMNTDDIVHNPNWQQYIELKNDINIAKEKLNIYSINNTDEAQRIADYINNYGDKK